MEYITSKAKHFKHCQCYFSIIFNAERTQSLHKKPETSNAAAITAPVVVIVLLITVIVVVVILRYLITILVFYISFLYIT